MSYINGYDFISKLYKNNIIISIESHIQIYVAELVAFSDFNKKKFMNIWHLLVDRFSLSLFLLLVGLDV